MTLLSRVVNNTILLAHQSIEKQKYKKKLFQTLCAILKQNDATQLNFIHSKPI